MYIGPIIALIVLLLLVAAIAWPRWDLTIRAHGDRVDVRGRLPLSKRLSIIHFFAHDLARSGKSSVKVRRDPYRGCVFQIRGPYSLGDEQRIRNFLLTIL